MQEDLRRRSGKLVVWLVMTLLDKFRPRRGLGIKVDVFNYVDTSSDRSKRRERARWCKSDRTENRTESGSTKELRSSRSAEREGTGVSDEKMDVL